MNIMARYPSSSDQVREIMDDSVPTPPLSPRTDDGEEPMQGDALAVTSGNGVRVNQQEQPHQTLHQRTWSGMSTMLSNLFRSEEAAALLAEDLFHSGKSMASMASCSGRGENQDNGSSGLANHSALASENSFDHGDKSLSRLQEPVSTTTADEREVFARIFRSLEDSKFRGRFDPIFTSGSVCTHTMESHISDASEEAHEPSSKMEAPVEPQPHLPLHMNLPKNDSIPTRSAEWIPTGWLPPNDANNRDQRANKMTTGIAPAAMEATNGLDFSRIFQSQASATGSLSSPRSHNQLSPARISRTLSRPNSSLPHDSIRSHGTSQNDKEPAALFQQYNILKAMMTNALSASATGAPSSSTAAAAAALSIQASLTYAAGNGFPPSSLLLPNTRALSGESTNWAALEEDTLPPIVATPLKSKRIEVPGKKTPILGSIDDSTEPAVACIGDRRRPTEIDKVTRTALDYASQSSKGLGMGILEKSLLDEGKEEQFVTVSNNPRQFSVWSKGECGTPRPCSNEKISTQNASDIKRNMTLSGEWMPSDFVFKTNDIDFSHIFQSQQRLVSSKDVASAATSLAFLNQYQGHDKPPTAAHQSKPRRHQFEPLGTDVVPPALIEGGTTAQDALVTEPSTVSTLSSYNDLPESTASVKALNEIPDSSEHLSLVAERRMSQGSRSRESAMLLLSKSTAANSKDTVARDANTSKAGLSASDREPRSSISKVRQPSSSDFTNDTTFPIVAAEKKRKGSLDESSSKGAKKPRSARKRRTPQPDEFEYCEPTENDVLLGRGGRTNHHSGNKRYLDAKVEIQPRYMAASKDDKTGISQELVDRVHGWGGKFLKLDEKNQRWYVVHPTVARKKASQTLREMNTPEVRAEKRERYCK